MGDANAAISASRARAQAPAFRRAAYVVAFSALLNPLNSSIISVALLRIAGAYSVGIAQATWLITGYFLATAIGQPVMGKLADLFGPRRIYAVGLTFVALFSLLSVWAPSFGWLLALRILQAFSNTASFPAGMSILQAMARTYGINNGKIPSSAMGLISITNNVTAALGPVAGGFLISSAGWTSVFWINVPIVLIVLVLFVLFVPAGDATGFSPHHPASIRKLLDLPGMLLFSGTLVSLMLLLLSLSSHPKWWLLAVGATVFSMLIVYERRREAPFFNVRMLGADGKLLAVYLQYMGSSFAFFCLFFGFPLWLERLKGFEPQTAGLAMLPLLGFGVIATQSAVRIIAKRTFRAPLVAGYLSLIAGALLLLFVQIASPLALIIAGLSLVGIANGFANMGLQTALYLHVKQEDMGTASGLFLTFRSLGSIFATSLIGIVYGAKVSMSGLHILVLVIVLCGVGLAITGFSRRLE